MYLIAVTLKKKNVNLIDIFQTYRTMWLVALGSLTASHSLGTMSAIRFFPTEIIMLKHILNLKTLTRLVRLEKVHFPSCMEINFSSIARFREKISPLSSNGPLFWQILQLPRVEETHLLTGDYTSLFNICTLQYSNILHRVCDVTKSDLPVILVFLTQHLEKDT